MCGSTLLYFTFCGSKDQSQGLTLPLTRTFCLSIVLRAQLCYDMGPNNGSLANGLHHVDIPSKLSATENEDVSRSQRIAAIATYYKAAHEMTARRMAKPTVLPASVTVFGFSAGAGDAEGMCSTACRVHALFFALCLPSACCTDRNAGAASGSESASPVSQRFDGEMLPSDNRLDAAIYFRLEAMRQDLLNHAAGETLQEPLHSSCSGLHMVHCQWLFVHCLLIVCSVY